MLKRGLQVGMDAEVDLKKFRDHAYAFVKFVSVEAAVMAKQRMERMALGTVAMR